ncbi:MAG: imidazole glycerol phosphate synthase subunit HisH [Gammaproteobacteria bacterium]
MIAVIDVGLGNPRSVQNMIRKAGGEAVITRVPSEIRAAEKLVLPGVGHFAHGMESLHRHGLVEELTRFALDLGRPVLGICLGAQLLGFGSEEGPGVGGLGWLPLHCRRFPSLPGLRIPQMGWNEIEIVRENALLREALPERRFYFVHSYYMECDDPEIVVARAHYGLDYACVVHRGNIYGTQFHPEKSHKFGLALMKAFVELPSSQM